MACVEAEEIARLAVDLERAIQEAQAEAKARRHAEKRLAAVETSLLQRKTAEPVQRSTSPARSPHGGAGCRIIGRSDVEGERDRGRGGWTTDLTKQDVFQAPSERNSERDSSSLPPPSRGALGSTIASRGRVVHGGPAKKRKEFCSCLKSKGRSPISPRRGRDAGLIDQRRPWGSSPPPSPRRGRDNGSSLSATIGRRRPLAGAGAAHAEHKQSPRRHSNERVPRERLHESPAASRCDPACRGGVTDKKRLPETTATAVDQHGRGSRNLYVDERETGTSGERRRPSATETRGGTNGTTTPTAAADATAETPRESQSMSGGGQETPSVAEAVAAAIRGIDLTETIARELRAAVATAPASTPCPGSANVYDRSSGQNSSADGGGGGGESTFDGTTCGRRSSLRGHEQRGETSVGCVEGGDLLSFIRQSNSASSWGGGTPAATVGPPSRDGGRCLKSREVADLESDVQHIFKFFAAKDGRNLSGLSGGADRGGVAKAPP